MTETKMEMTIISAVSNILPHAPLEQALHRVTEELGPPHFDDADRDFASRIRATLTEKDIASVYYAIGMDPNDRPLAHFLVPIEAKRNPLVGSTDVADVSWVVPTVEVHAPTLAIGTPLHTWQVVAQGKSPHAHKAIVQAAKAMASVGIKALNEPELIAAAKADLMKRRRRRRMSRRCQIMLLLLWRCRWHRISVTPDPAAAFQRPLLALRPDRDCEVSRCARALLWRCSSGCSANKGLDKDGHRTRGLLG
ncbi:hypothetical protein FBZ94_12020 [Bradyrhizobium sacchari]|uniref:Uncharacterized protein n=1 Tax=Bradyrhizobium sacchari TaxID=1399419 RepID=A0A560J453_9BRAD|nr:hypothetical protein FBZ94_12020 [Bradyrhizobium sacchari]TWB66018.1 hypothetical protein FBZ95_11914 [Bradyrhizobium sacchari]